VSGRNPLHWAAANGHKDAARRLLEHGVNPDTGDRHVRTALSWAAGNGQGETVSCLLRNGSDPHSEDVSGRNPLH
jgi:ankyrin repeat protein